MKNLFSKTLFISLLLSATIPSGVQANWLTSIKLVILEHVGKGLEKGCSPFAYRAGERLVEAYENSAAFQKIAVGAMVVVGGAVAGAADARLSGDQALILVKFVAFYYGVLAIENGHNPFKKTK